MTPLMHAIERNRKRIVKYLIDQGADLAAQDMVRLYPYLSILYICIYLYLYMYIYIYIRIYR